MYMEYSIYGYITPDSSRVDHASPFPHPQGGDIKFSLDHHRPVQHKESVEFFAFCFFSRLRPS